ncbi:hypothetical protein ANN_08490 [Periplaneta americana]|uniref:DUF4817 domain-containing protein n=1 Tax=Periplaneta americana TaxID=6978 RepID=A0ABQ8T1L5_PERAM|nr:hypothetical protein ANN_08490 [Periplaneta americana]
MLAVFCNYGSHNREEGVYYRALSPVIWIGRQNGPSLRHVKEQYQERFNNAAPNNTTMLAVVESFVVEKKLSYDNIHQFRSSIKLSQRRYQARIVFSELLIFHIYATMTPLLHTKRYRYSPLGALIYNIVAITYRMPLKFSRAIDVAQSADSLGCCSGAAFGLGLDPPLDFGFFRGLQDYALLEFLSERVRASSKRRLLHNVCFPTVILSDIRMRG